MAVMDTTTEPVADFFARYGHALSTIDLDTIADCYAYPSLAVTRLGRMAIAGPEQTKAFFAENSRRYHEQGIPTLHITNVRAGYDEDGLWVGFADLENLDADDRVVGIEHNAYQLVAEGGAWRIAVTTPLDAR